MTRKTLGLVLAFGALLVGSACSRNKPPNLTPDASMAFDNGQFIKAIDDGRDVAIITHSFNQVPFSTPITRRLVTLHQSLLVIVETRAENWQVKAQALMAEGLKNLTGEAHARYEPYVELARAILRRLGTRAFDEPVSAEVIAAYRELLKRSNAVDSDWLASHP